ncbi:hypothetical protein XENTR_v10003606 [Xenopus tropicalis]|nr:hypothetical protein XENTR_v10003606 [Xenopus tropicalis]
MYIGNCLKNFSLWVKKKWLQNSRNHEGGTLSMAIKISTEKCFYLNLRSYEYWKALRDQIKLHKFFMDHTKTNNK